MIQPVKSAPDAAGEAGREDGTSPGVPSPEPSRRPDRLGLTLWPWLAARVIRVLRLSLRLDHVGREPVDALEREGRNYILAFWHAHLLMMTYACGGRPKWALISRHRDGELIARTMRRFGHEAIRGSTTRGGAPALRQVVRALRQGRDVAFTPDGPKGPRFRVQKGVILAARMGRVPIVPVAFSARPCRILSSWDRFVVPWPFARARFRYGAPLEVPPDADEAGQEEARRRLERTLRALLETGGDGQAAGLEDLS